MKIYEIDTGCLTAKKGATIIKMVTIQDMLKELYELNDGTLKQSAKVLDLIDKLEKEK